MSKKEVLPDYPFRWEGLEDFSYRKDDRGLPLVDMGKELGLRYNPITISQYGLFNLQEYSETSKEAYLKTALTCADWLIKNAREWRENTIAWVYDYSLDFYGPEAPWISGMAQGQAISLLLRCHQHQKIDNLKEITKRAFNVFLHPVNEGGIVSSFPDSSLVFEEYPTIPPSQVLNGHIFALLGIYDFGEFWNEAKVKELFSVAVDGLSKNLHLYDTGFWNTYDLHPSKRLASPMYIKVHIQLLDILFQLTSDKLIHGYANRWQSYLNNPICRIRWFLTKVAEKVRLRN